MTTTCLTDEQLDALRRVGDPELEKLDAPSPEYFEKVTADGVIKALVDEPAEAAVRKLGDAAFRDWPQSAAKRFGLHEQDLWPRVQDGQRLFEHYGNEIAAALLLAGLPELYATQWGAPVLVAHGELIWHVRRRIRQTAQFLLDVLSREPDGTELASGTARLRSASVAVRYFHHALRQQLEQQTKKDPKAAGLGAKNSPPYCPLNQEDLLGTLLTFTVTVFRVFSAFGIELSSDQQLSYLLLWDLVGELMGIGDVSAAAAAETAATAASIEAQNAVHQAAFAAFAAAWTANGAVRADIAARRGARTAADDAAKAARAVRETAVTARLKKAAIADLRAAAAAKSTRPASVAEAWCVLGMMHGRQWLPVDDSLTGPPNGGPFPLPSDPLHPGRILTRALLDELISAMPPLRRWLPLDAMRALAPDIVRARLGLPNGGLIDYGWVRLPKRRWRSDPYTTFETPNRVRSTVLRLAAGDISRHVFLAFLRSDGPPFEFPNIDFSEFTPAPRKDHTYIGPAADAP